MEARRKRDGGELEASWRRDADGGELEARRRRRWRRDGRCRRETGASFRLTDDLLRACGLLFMESAQKERWLIAMASPSSRH